MSKALTVLAECVDARSGRRFTVGDVFDPLPSVGQAGRLVQAGCLPPAAVDVALAAEAAAEKATEDQTAMPPPAPEKTGAEKPARNKARAD